MNERCKCDCNKLPKFNIEDVQRILPTLRDTYGLFWIPMPMLDERKSVEENTALMLLEGMNEELEHCDITCGDPILTARIALAHLKEEPAYYMQLKDAGLTIGRTKGQTE